MGPFEMTNLIFLNDPGRGGAAGNWAPRHEPLSYRSLGSLPAQPGALVKRLAEIPAESA
jgi:hypothetical protein